MSRIALIDYGAGNLRSAERALAAAGGDVVVTSDPSDIDNATRIVLPGQGAFGDCMRGLNERAGLRDALERNVREQRKPFLGICVGMQLLAETGVEHGEHAGLGWIDGVCNELAAGGDRLPHMGWSEVTITTEHPVFASLAPARFFYFAHSFVLRPAVSEVVAATARHGERFTAAVAKANILGVQFHPEKSQAAGLALLERFVGWTPS